MTDTRATHLPSFGATAAWRAVACALLWLLLTRSVTAGDLLVGALTAAAAAIASLRLLPPTSGCVHYGRLLALLPHFAWESTRAGLDVAWRAFQPRVPLSPGFVSCPLQFPPGYARNTFAAITSLLPGTVPCDESDHALVYHCLDDQAPVIEQLWQEERLFARALAAGRRHG
jgi:multicomponent Na+:H+ antiporter subunit E